MKKYILSIFAVLVWFAGVAQNQDETIFRAMDAELGRSMNELQMDDLGKPFWIGYIYSDIDMMQIRATLGEIVWSAHRPQRYNATRLLFGGYDMTSDINYTPSYMPRQSSLETDEAQIRREFWFNTDANYKATAPTMARKAAMRRQSARSAEEEALPDLLPVAAVEKYVDWYPFGFDRAHWESVMERLSAVFADYPALYKTGVSFAAFDWNNYAASTEGVRTRQPVSYASISARGTVRTPDGEEFSDELRIYAPSDLTLPSEDELRAQVELFAANLCGYAEAAKIEEFYSGPVLFTGQPVFEMFDNNLLAGNGSGLLVRRRSENSGNQGNANMISFGGGGGSQPAAGSRKLENRIGQRVLDRKFTVTNHSTLREFGDTPLLGYYEIDADGVIPKAAETVIEDGMLRNVLNGRFPTLKSPASTGSNRFNTNLGQGVAPGTLEIAATGGKPLAELEKELLALASADGLEYAYVVERINGKFALVWKVDAATGERTLVRNAEIRSPSLTQLKRVAGVSDEREVCNYMANQVPFSMIYPSAILLEDVEIGELETTKDKPSPIVNPLQRGLGVLGIVN